LDDQFNQGATMFTRVTTHLRHHLVAYLALFVALGGTSYAATRLPADSVSSEQIVNGSVQAIDLAAHARTELAGGETLRGNFSLGSGSTGGHDYATDSISFVFTLPSAPKPHFIAFGKTPPAACPGTLALPKAAPGHLCVYEAEPTGGIDSTSIGDPVSGNVDAANRYGAIVSFHADSNLMVATSGTWAVTAA
jgi:hypothetical protein